MDALNVSNVVGAAVSDKVGAATGTEVGAGKGCTTASKANAAGTDTPCAIDVSSLSFSYPGCTPVLRNVNWRVAQGAFVLLVGATGSGKTTLLRLLKPEVAPSGCKTGDLCVLGTSLDAWRPVDSAAGIGYVAQNPENQLVCDTVWHELAFGLENLGVSQDVMRRRIAEVAHFFGIEPWMRRAVAGLSGGQKQTVNLAGVLAMQSRLLLLDEPTAQLDPVAEKNFLHLLFRVNRELGITVVVATHAPEAMADYATECICLEDGRAKPLPLAQVKAGWVASGAAIPASVRAAGNSVAAPAAGDSASSPVAGNSATAPAIASVLSVDDAYFRYAKGADWVLRGIDIAVARGSIHAIVGGNGCGKSTLLRVFAGALRPERGRVKNACARMQALLPQDPKALFVCDTVREELDEWQKRCGYDDEAVCAMARRFGLDALFDRHPYDLSGGQQQKLAFAKLLLTSPDLLLLDEPTKGLDAPSRLEVAHALRACAHEGRTIVMATHDLAFVSAVADNVSLLFDGEVACTEPTGQFFEGNLFYRPAPDGFTRLFSASEAEDVA